MTCYSYQERIHQQQTAISSLDQQIDFSQSQLTSLLKQTLIKRSLFITRHFIVEEYVNSNLKYKGNPLELMSFTNDGSDVSANFASLDLPDDFSKGPMKAFLNNLLDSLETFLPAFYNLNPSKLPRSNFYHNPSLILLRCVFPALFAYSWATEPARAYANNLLTWFKEVYNMENDLLNHLKKHWMYQAMKGFFSTLDLTEFIKMTIKPVFMDFIQLQKESQMDTKIWLKYAKKILESIKKNYYLLPNVINSFYLNLFEIVGEKNINLVIKDLFYDMIIKPTLMHPILEGVFDIILPTGDYINFEKVYVPFQLKFGDLNENEIPNLNEIDFSDFEPYCVIEEIKQQKAKQTLPYLEKFCTIVRCSHQPLLLTTHHISLLFRFVASLQHSGTNLPSIIIKSISNVFQEALPDQLEVIPDKFFWFPCYSLSYMSIPPINLGKESKTIPIYKLLSNPNFVVNPLTDDFIKALKNAAQAIPLTTHPEIKVESQWLFKNYGEDENYYTHELDLEIGRKQKEIDERRERIIDILSLTRFLQDENESISEGPLRELAIFMFPKFTSAFNCDIRSNSFISKAKANVKEFCGKSFPLIGKHFLSMLFVEIVPWVKSNLIYNDSTNDISEEISYIRDHISKPLNVSSNFSICLQLSHDLIFIKEYSEINEVNFIELVKTVYQPPFLHDLHNLAAHMYHCLSLPNDLVSSVFTEDEFNVMKELLISFGFKELINKQYTL